MLFRVGNITPSDYGTIDFKALECLSGSADDGLYNAIKQRSLSAVIQRVDSGADVLGSFEDEQSPLHFAAGMGHIPVIEYLLNRGANVFARDGDGGLPRGTALENKEPAAAELLDNWRRDVLNAYAMSVRAGDVQAAKLFERNTSSSFQQMELQPLLHDAALSANTDMLLHLLEAYPLGNDVLVSTLRQLSDAKDARATPAIQLLASRTLHLAAARGTTEHLWSLFPCDRLLDINAIEEGDTALHALVKKVPEGRSQLERTASKKLEALLMFEPDASIRDADGLTAMEIAQQSGLKRIFAQLERYTSPK